MYSLSSYIYIKTDYYKQVQKDIQLINTQEEFDKIYNKFEQAKELFIDTEFDRRKTYYAKLSLIQMISRSDKVIIDVLSGIDISKFKNLLINPDILKVFHAPLQDFEIFLHYFKILPQNIFDTQIAATVANFTQRLVGYDALARSLLDVYIDKTLQKANWLTRPLESSLLEYAIKDTEYLIPMYDILSERLTQENAWPRYHEQLQSLLCKKRYQFTPEKILKKFYYEYNTIHFENRLKNLITLREECAIQLNIPRGFCASNDILMKICHVLPKSQDDLKRHKIGHSPLTSKKFCNKLFDLCQGIDFKI